MFDSCISIYGKLKQAKKSVMESFKWIVYFSIKDYGKRNKSPHGLESSKMGRDGRDECREFCKRIEWAKMKGSKE